MQWQRSRNWVCQRGPSFKDFRTEVRAAIARLDNDIKSAVTELRAEIRAMASRAENDLRNYATQADAQFSEMRRENHAQFAEIRKAHKELREKVDQVAADVSTIGSKMNALFWVLGGLVALAGLAKTLGWI